MWEGLSKIWQLFFMTVLWFSVLLLPVHYQQQHWVLSNYCEERCTVITSKGYCRHICSASSMPTLKKKQQLCLAFYKSPVFSYLPSFKCRNPTFSDKSEIAHLLKFNLINKFLCEVRNKQLRIFDIKDWLQKQKLVKKTSLSMKVW